MQNAVDRAKLPGRRGLPRSQFDDVNLTPNHQIESNKKCTC